MGSVLDGKQHPYDFRREPKKYKSTGFSLTLDDWQLLRDYAARMNTSASALLREWTEPHLAKIRNAPLPPPLDTDEESDAV